MIEAQLVLNDATTLECVVGTHGLRWNDGILEQPWKCRKGGRFWVEWRPVPSCDLPKPG